MRTARMVAAISALAGWAALALQYVILAERIGPALGAWRFVGYFTILSNIAVAGIATAVALGSENRLAGPRARLMGLTAIVTVGLVYSLLLRSTWNPAGWQKLADAALHDVTPILFAVLWTLMPHRGLKWTDLNWALMPPALYLVYALGRGAVDGWYAYYFLDPTLQTGAGLTISALGTLLLFAVVACGAIALDRRLAARSRTASPPL